MQKRDVNPKYSFAKPKRRERASQVHDSNLPPISYLSYYILSPTQVLLRLRSGFQKFDQPLMFITRGHIHRLIFIQSRLFLKVGFR